MKLGRLRSPLGTRRFAPARAALDLCARGDGVWLGLVADGAGSGGHGDAGSGGTGGGSGGAATGQSGGDQW